MFFYDLESVLGGLILGLLFFSPVRRHYGLRLPASARAASRSAATEPARAAS